MERIQIVRADDLYYHSLQLAFGEGNHALVRVIVHHIVGIDSPVTSLKLTVQLTIIWSVTSCCIST